MSRAKTALEFSRKNIRLQNRAIMSGLAVQPAERTQTIKIFRSMLFNEPMPDEVKARRRIMLYVDYTGGLAFSESFLETISLPGSLRIIGSRAFMDCTSLKDLYTPPSLQYVEISAFDGCPNGMTVIGYKDTLAQNFAGRYKFNFCGMSSHDPRFEITPSGNLIVHEGSEKSETAILPSYYMSSSAKRLLHAKYLRSHKVILPKYLEEIAGSSFYGNRYLQGISLPETAKIIGVLSFARCPGLKSIGLNEGLERIGQAAFAECTSLESVIIPLSSKSDKPFSFRGLQESQRRMDIF